MLWGVRRYFLSASLLGYSNSGELSNAKVEFCASPVERIFHRRAVLVSPFFSPVCAVRRFAFAGNETT